MSTLTVVRGTPDIEAVVAEELRVLIARKRTTQAALADVIGISQSQMSKRMNGIISFNISELALLADHFGVSVAALVGGPPEPGGSGPDGGIPADTPSFGSEGWGFEYLRARQPLRSAA